MIVRPATRDDLPAIVGMSAKFYATTHYARFAAMDSGSVQALAETMIGTGTLLVAEHGGELVGMVGLVVVPFMFNTGATVACEVVWWVDPDARTTGAGAALLRAVEPACRAAGADVIQMVHLADSPPVAAKLYQRAGYTYSESSYTKEVQAWQP